MDWTDESDWALQLAAFVVIVAVAFVLSNL